MLQLPHGLPMVELIMVLIIRGVLAAVTASRFSKSVARISASAIRGRVSRIASRSATYPGYGARASVVSRSEARLTGGMAGFTLIELIMVLVILGVLAAVVGPRFFERQVFDERLFYEETLSAVRYAQKLALASGCRVQVGLGAGGYSLRRAANCTNGDFTATVLGADGQTYADAAPPSGVVVSATNFPVVFDSLGAASGAADATIGDFTLTVNAGTGLVQ